VTAIRTWELWPILQNMKVKTRVCCAVLLLLATVRVGSEAKPTATVKGVVLDIASARIWNAKLTFGDGVHQYDTQTREDGAYSIELKPGTYTMSVYSYGFCTLRRAAFVLQEHSMVQFNFQMWVCPTDTEFIQYTELDEVPHTHLKPLVLFAKKDSQGELQRSTGPNTFDDGTGKARKYPAVFTFNLLTVQGQELLYDSTKHLVTASGNVLWQDENNSGGGAKVEINLDGLKSSIIRSVE
jgi:hypothetical protein